MFKSSLRYGLYFFAGLWMFALGVMVGRGSSPITFDTRGFQARLEAIAREYGGQKEAEQKVDLKFYDVLNRPADQAMKSKKAGEILPKSDPGPENGQLVAADGVPVKLSKKMESLDPELLAAYQDRPTPVRAKPVPAKPVSHKKAAPKENTVPMVAKRGYTIQLAAFKSAKDALSEAERLKKKGVAVYRVEGKGNGGTWHRIRTGAYPDYKAAQAALEKLRAVKVKGMIIKKE